jgi:hypothetical protein
MASDRVRLAKAIMASDTIPTDTILLGFILDYF